MADLEGSESTEIDAPVERCFAIAADIERAPEWQGSMRSAHVVDRDEDGRARLVDSEFDASIAKVKLRLRFSYDEPHGLRWTREEGDLKSLDGSWRLEDLGDGRTRATYSLEIGLNRALRILRKGVRGPAEGQVRHVLLGKAVEGLKGRAEGERS